MRSWGCRGALALRPSRALIASCQRSTTPDSKRQTIRRLRRVFSGISLRNEPCGDDEKRKAFDRGEIDAEASRASRVFRAVVWWPRRARRSGRLRELHFPQRQRRRARRNSPAPGGFEDILNSMFAGAQRGARRAAVSLVRIRQPAASASISYLNVAMTVSLEESINGAEKRVRLPTGKELTSRSPPVSPQASRSASRAGRNRARPSSGRTSSLRSIAPHPFFKVDGSDLRVDLPITLMRRCSAQGPGADARQRGRPHDPQNTSSGRIFRLKGKGLPKGGWRNGRSLITTRSCCRRHDAELEALMQKWRDTHPYNHAAMSADRGGSWMIVAGFCRAIASWLGLTVLLCR